ncbi:MAG TPA: tetratricopeptide repeat protein [Gammaproteobacteria bacterium]
MSIKVLFRTLALLLALATLSACTGMQGPGVAPSDTAGRSGTTESAGSDTTQTTDTAVLPDTPLDTPPDTPVEPPPPSANPAVIALLDNAQADASAGRLPTATAAIERALRIEPKNPALWQKLATLKLEKGEYQQAENFAARSNSWAGSNKSMQARNWHIISEARSLRGDNAGAKAALARARALEPAAAE